MTTHAVDARIAFPARGVDLTDHATARQRRAFRLDDTADELVAGHAAVFHIAAGDLEVGAAEAGENDFDDALARGRDRIGIVGAQLETAIKDQGALGNALKQKSRAGG
jgi:hypothetical protein